MRNLNIYTSPNLHKYHRFWVSASAFLLSACSTMLFAGSLTYWLFYRTAPTSASAEVLISSSLDSSLATTLQEIPEVILTSVYAPSPDLPLTLHGHYYYDEADSSRLVLVGYYGGTRPEYLDKDAANAFIQMQQAANAEGVSIAALSAFRDHERQAILFERQVERQGSEVAAARISAPPGYSEHHSGYTLDIGDGNAPNHDFSTSFETTDAFQWLQAHAEEYGFELSFIKENKTGVMYEPWHWRYVGSAHARYIFRNAR